MISTVQSSGTSPTEPVLMEDVDAVHARVGLRFPNLAVLFALNDQISTKFKLNKNQIYWSTANTIKYHVLNRSGVYLVGLTP